MSNKISVKTSSSDEYSITVGVDVLDRAAQYISNRFSRSKLFIVIDEKVYRLHNEYINKHLSESFSKIILYVVPSGEKSKSLDQFSRIVDFILENGVERSTPLMAIGGGVVGDLVGFVAASVLRGIPLFHVPTTLLAMVDSSIGGKTGVNHSTGKNLIGSFYQPKGVFADVNFLKSLDEKEWVNGLSEIIKYGMIEDSGILSQINELVLGKSFGSPEKWTPLIEKSAGIKCEIVSKDVLESGPREFLNFGHTFAHVIEQKGKFESFSHGEAVFAGMFGAVAVSNSLGANIDIANLSQFKPLYDFSLREIGNDVAELTELMLRDKKVKNQTIRLVLLEDIEKPIVQTFEETSLVEKSWEFLTSEFN